MSNRDYYRSGRHNFSLTDRHIWEYFKPITKEVRWANQYYLKFRATTPGHGSDTCTTAEMRQRFRYMGYDLVVGWGKPIYNPNQEGTGWFCETKYSLVIPGYWNLPYVDLNNAGCDQDHDLEIDFYGKHGTIYNNAKQPLVLGSSSGHYSGRTLTWELFQKILGEATSFYIRTWVREKYVCESDAAYRDVGFLYAGWVNNFDHPTDGHTFNRGLMVRLPRPQISYITHRLNDYVDDGNEFKYPIKIRIEFDPMYSVFRGPSDGLIANTNASLSFVERFGDDYYYDIDIQAQRETAKFIFWERVHGTDIINQRNGWHMIGGQRTWTDAYGHAKVINSYYKEITMDVGEVNKDPWKDSNQGTDIWSRIMTHQLGDANASWRHGPMDNGYELRGWDIRFDEVSNGSCRNDKFRAALTDCRNNRYPKSKLEFSCSMGPRANNTVSPKSTIGFNAHGSDQDGDELTVGWKMRSNQVFQFDKNYWAKDILLEHQGQYNDITVAEVIKKFEAVYGRPCDRHEFGCEASLKDTFYENGHKKTSKYMFTGPSWSGYKIEYPIDNVRAIIPDQPTAMVGNHKVTPGRYIKKVVIQYDTPRGYDGVKHHMEAIGVSALNAGLSDRIFTTALMGTPWHSGGDWNSRLKDWTTNHEASNIDTFALIKHDNNLRGNYVCFFVGTVTQGGWDYDKWHNEHNDTSSVFYINKYPACTLLQLDRHFENNDASCYTRVSFRIQDDNFKLKTKKIDLVFDNPKYGHKTLEIENMDIFHENTNRVDPVGQYNITAVLQKNNINHLDLIGQEMQIHVHGCNIFEFSETWDGTRTPINGQQPWMKTFIYDVSPNPDLHLSNTKNETVNVSITHTAGYAKRVKYTIKVKAKNEPDSALKTLVTDVEHPNVLFNPLSHGYAVSLRGSQFEFVYDFKVVLDNGAVDFSKTGIKETDRFWTWNEIPNIVFKEKNLSYRTINDDNKITKINTNWGDLYRITTTSNDPDTKVLTYHAKSNNAWFEIYRENLNHNAVDNTINITPATLLTKNPNSYPITITQDVSYTTGIEAKCVDIFNMESNTLSTRAILLKPLVRSNIRCEAGQHASVENGVIKGLNVIFKANLDHTNKESQFISSIYQFRHYILCREVGTTNQFWIDTQCWHKGNQIPAEISMNFNAFGTNYDRNNIKPNKIYEFILYTTIQTTTDDKTKLYLTESRPFGKFMFGVTPEKPVLLFPKNNKQPLRNPPLIIHFPDQPDSLNKEIDDFAIIWKGQFVGWNSSSQWFPGNVNYVNRTIVAYWNNANGDNAVTNISIMVKSKMTQVTAQTPDYLINCGYSDLTVSPGQLIHPLTNIQNAINELRQAYGLGNYAFPNVQRGMLITYDLLVNNSIKAYNEFGELVKSYGGTYKPMNITQETLIKANISNKFKDMLIDYKK